MEETQQCGKRKGTREEEEDLEEDGPKESHVSVCQGEGEDGEGKDVKIQDEQKIGGGGQPTR